MRLALMCRMKFDEMVMKKKAQGMLPSLSPSCCGVNCNLARSQSMQKSQPRIIIWVGPATRVTLPPTQPIQFCLKISLSRFNLPPSLVDCLDRRYSGFPKLDGASPLGNLLLCLCLFLFCHVGYINAFVPGASVSRARSQDVKGSSLLFDDVVQLLHVPWNHLPGPTERIPHRIFASATSSDPQDEQGPAATHLHSSQPSSPITTGCRRQVTGWTQKAIKN